MGDILSMGTNAYFNMRFLGIVFNNRQLALKGNYNTGQWPKSSMQIFDFIEDCGGKFHIEGLESVDELKGEVVLFEITGNGKEQHQFCISFIQEQSEKRNE